MDEVARNPGDLAPSGDLLIESTLGPQLVTRLSGLVRAGRLYSLSNQTVQSQVDGVLQVLARIPEHEILLLAMEQHFYLNGVRIKSPAMGLIHFSSLTAELEMRGLGGLRFVEGLTPEALTAFLGLFVTANNPAWGERLPEAAAEAGILHIVPVRTSEIAALQPSSGADLGVEQTERTRAQRIFWRAVSGSRAIWEAAERTGRPPLRQARRVVQPLVDTLMKNEHSILGLAALKSHDEYTYAHSVNVSTISIAIGQRLGMTRNELAGLGVGALLHDLGKLAVPAEVLRKTGRLNPEEWRQVEQHPVEGVRMMSRLPGLSAQALDAMWVCLQHHLTCNGKGYPRVDRPWTLSVVARIVSAADCYDAMTGHRAYRERPLSGFEGLQEILGAEEDRFDPAVLWALVRSVGLYPAGTVMVTRSGFTVLSLSPNPEDPARPFCEVIARPDGAPPSSGNPVTWDPMPRTESVARVVPPEETGLDLEGRLAA